MFGTYDESAKIVEKLIQLYQGLPVSQSEREAAVNALMAARAMILKEEEDAIGRCEHYFDGERFPKNSSEFGDLPFDVRSIDMSLRAQQARGGN